MFACSNTFLSVCNISVKKLYIYILYSHTCTHILEVELVDFSIMISEVLFIVILWLVIILKNLEALIHVDTYIGDNNTGTLTHYIILCNSPLCYCMLKLKKIAL